MITNTIGMILFLLLAADLFLLIVSLFRKRMNTKLFGVAAVAIFFLFLASYLIHCKTAPTVAPEPTPAYSFAPIEETPSPTPEATEAPPTPTPSPTATAPAKKTQQQPVRTPQQDIPPATQTPIQTQPPVQSAPTEPEVPQQPSDTTTEQPSVGA